MKNPQTTFAPTFLTHIIARIDGVIKQKYVEFDNNHMSSYGLTDKNVCHSTDNEPV